MPLHDDVLITLQRIPCASRSCPEPTVVRDGSGSGNRGLLVRVSQILWWYFMISALIGVGGLAVGIFYSVQTWRADRARWKAWLP